MLALLQSNQMLKKFKFSKFDQHKAANDGVYSPPFYTSPGGYKMRILVYANGEGEGRGTDVSVYVFFMEGENDNHLPLPFAGKVTIELLNQLEDNHHHSKTMKFPPDDDTSQQQVNIERSITGYGYTHYIQHTALDHIEADNCQYLKYDCLYFRISVDTAVESKPWLI